MKQDIIAIDPGLNATGYAFFQAGILVESGIVATHKKFDKALKAATVANALRQFYGRFDTAVAEWPQVYRAGRSVGDPNDLLWLAYLLGEIASTLDTIPRFVTPAIWTAGLPPKSKTKKVENQREIRIRSKLSPAENLLMKSQHDTVDAVGIGLYYLGRLKPNKVYSGATP